jgi:hypothetical protein
MSRRLIRQTRRLSGTSLGGGAFNPTQISTLLAWYRSDLGITLNGSTVSGWADQSGNGHNVTQATGTKQPTYATSDASYNGYPSLTFVQASSQNLASSTFTAIAQPLTYIFVGKLTAAPTNTCQLCDGSVQRPIMYVSSGSTTVLNLQEVGGAAFSGTASPVLTTPFVAAGLFNGASSAIFQNNSQTALASGTTGTNGVDQIQLSSNSTQAWNGSFTEVLVYQNLSSSDRQRLFVYLGTRYNISTS